MSTSEDGNPLSSPKNQDPVPLECKMSSIKFSIVNRSVNMLHIEFRTLVGWF